MFLIDKKFAAFPQFCYFYPTKFLRWDGQVLVKFCATDVPAGRNDRAAAPGEPFSFLQLTYSPVCITKTAPFK